MAPLCDGTGQWHHCVTGQDDGTPCCQCNRPAIPNSLVQTNSPGCRREVFAVSVRKRCRVDLNVAAGTRSAARRTPPGHRLTCTSSRTNASCQCTLLGHPVSDMEPHSGRAWGTFLHLIATICHGCKGRDCAVPGFVHWGRSTSAFLPATLRSMPKHQLAPRWFR